jgi:hypothetical protein
MSKDGWGGLVLSLLLLSPLVYEGVKYLRSRFKR